MTVLTTVSCSAYPRTGVLGRHVQKVLDARSTEETRFFGPGSGIKHGAAWDWARRSVLHWTPARFRSAWRMEAGSALFDWSVASSLVEGPQTHIAFAGQALATLRRARRLGYGRCELVAATPHVNYVAERHRRATEQFGIERDWLSDSLRHRTLLEYELADVIHVPSSLSCDSFRAQGVPAAKLRRVTLSAAPRFQLRSPASQQSDEAFRVVYVVYVGSLTVAKGTPVLVEAFRRLNMPTARCTLVDGYQSRGTRRYLEDAVQRGPRLQIAVGDPLSCLPEASVYVHPSYQDGFGYAPAEALACGVPLIVTADTRMREMRTDRECRAVAAGAVEGLARCLRELAVYLFGLGQAMIPFVQLRRGAECRIRHAPRYIPWEGREP